MFPILDPEDPRIEQHEVEYGGREKLAKNPLLPFIITKNSIALAREDIPSLDIMCNRFPTAMSVLFTLLLTPMILFLYVRMAADMITGFFRR